MEILALLISLAAVAAAYRVAVTVFEAVPHVEDEMAYVWEAKVLAHGQLTVSSPPDPSNLMVPFVLDVGGQRFAKYPPGWPMVLALGLLLGIRTWVNPLLAGLAVWLTFRLGQKVFGTGTGLLAALLTLTSPFFLINSGSLDSHPWSLVLSLAFCLAWLDTFDQGRPASGKRPSRLQRGLTVCLAGLSLGALAITRPLTAVGVGLPFFVCGLFLLRRGDAWMRKRVLAIGLLALLSSLLLPAWQYVVTGNPLTDPYTLLWKFDRLGFGPGVGNYPGGYTPLQGMINAAIMLAATAKDLFGWGHFSWLFLPAGLWAIRKNRSAWLVASVFFSLMVCYFFYWAYVVRYGPRYYYEGLYSLTLVSAAGIVWLANRLKSGWGRRVGIAAVAGFTAALIAFNLFTYLPARFDSIYGLYGIHRSQLAPFQTAQARSQTPALVFVHVENTWTDYAGLLELEDPWLKSPFIFAWSAGPTADARVARDYPNRKIRYFYPDDPSHLYLAPK